MRLLLALISMVLIAATSAEASTIVRLDYTGGSSSQGNIQGNWIVANVSDTLSFDVVVVVGPLVEEINFDLRWMDDSDLSLLSTNFESGMRLVPSDPPLLADLRTPDAPVVSDGVGLVGNIGWTPSEAVLAAAQNDPGIPLGELFLGSLVFHVKGPNQSLIETGFFQEGASAVNSRGKFFTPSFRDWRVKTRNSVPEPGAASLLLLGLAGLWAAGRSSTSA